MLQVWKLGLRAPTPVPHRSHELVEQAAQLWLLAYRRRNTLVTRQAKLGIISTRSNNLILMKRMYLVIFTVIIADSVAENGHQLNLPTHHIPYHFHSDPSSAQKCVMENCAYTDKAGLDTCWGYEHNCDPDWRYSKPSCNGSSESWERRPKKNQMDMFYKQADFGYIKNKRDSYQYYCTPRGPKSSSLKCTQNMEFCYGSNIYIDFLKV